MGKELQQGEEGQRDCRSLAFSRTKEAVLGA